MTTKKSEGTTVIPESQSRSLYEMYETDDKMEREGIELEYGEAVFRVARAGGANSRYQKVLEAKTKKFRRQIETETLDAAINKRLSYESFAEGVLLGWSNVKDKKGKVLPFSVENAVKLFTDLPDLFRDLNEQASKFANFRAAEIEGDSGN